MAQDSSTTPAQADQLAPPVVPDINLSGTLTDTSAQNEKPPAAKVRVIDISEQGDKKGVSEVTGQDLLKFARHILIWLLILSFVVMLMYYFSDRKGTNEVAAKEIFEVIKIGVLPLVSLVIGFYFRKTDK